MLRKSLPVTVIAAFFLIVACGKTEDTSQKKPADQIVAAVSFLAGSVEVERDGAVQPLKVGDLLKPADLIITGEDSGADLSMKDYGIMKIGSTARIRVLDLTRGENGSSARVGVEKGKLVSLINRKDSNQNYEVVTPTAVAGVRGTVFLTSVDEGQKGKITKIAVLSGAVAVNPGDSEIVLTEGTQVVVDENRRISREMVRPMGEDSLKEIKRLSVFHRTNVFEYNSMMEDIRQATPELKELEGNDSADASLERRTVREAQMGKDQVKKADEVDLTRQIKRDTEGDPIKLEPGSGFE